MGVNIARNGLFFGQNCLGKFYWMRVPLVPWLGVSHQTNHFKFNNMDAMLGDRDDYVVKQDFALKYTHVYITSPRMNGTDNPWIDTTSLQTILCECDKLKYGDHDTMLTSPKGLKITLLTFRVIDNRLLCLVP
jgi:hypothetical protein